MELAPVLFALALCLPASILLARRLGRQAARGRLAALTAERDRAVADSIAAGRLLRLAAGELNSGALAVLGHAERLRCNEADAHAHALAIAGNVAQFLMLADDLQDHLVPAPSSRVLTEDTVMVGAAARNAIDAVVATLGPSRRHWRIARSLEQLVIRADPRALDHVLRRVVANAARFSKPDDWIDLRAETAEGEVLVIVEDEGAGFAAAGAADQNRKGVRGLSLGLSLARVLMEAHGGALSVESAARVGTRVTLAFPQYRVVGNALPGGTAPGSGTALEQWPDAEPREAVMHRAMGRP